MNIALSSSTYDTFRGTTCRLRIHGDTDPVILGVYVKLSEEWQCLYSFSMTPTDAAYFMGLVQGLKLQHPDEVYLLYRLLFRGGFDRHRRPVMCVTPASRWMQLEDEFLRKLSNACIPTLIHNGRVMIPEYHRKRILFNTMSS